MEEYISEVNELIERGFYSMSWQPIVDLSSSGVLGYEALFRGPKGTPFANPGELFGSGALSDDILLKLDMSCIESAMRTSRLLPDNKLLFVNVCGETLCDNSEFTEKIFVLMSSMQLSPERLVFEISERTGADYIEEMTETLGTIRNKYVRIALDDIQANLSPLVDLFWLEPDFMKLDMELIRDIDSNEEKQDIVREILGATENMDTRFIAEEVETEAELKTVLELGINFVQGYLMYKPLPANRWQDIFGKDGTNIPKIPGLVTYNDTNC